MSRYHMFSGIVAFLLNNSMNLLILRNLCCCWRQGEKWELQLKGSGKTPYSRYSLIFYFSRLNKNWCCLNYNWKSLLSYFPEEWWWQSGTSFLSEGIFMQWGNALSQNSNQQSCKVIPCSSMLTFRTASCYLQTCISKVSRQISGSMVSHGFQWV